MFTGIIETLGTVQHLENDQTNLNITLKTPLAQELKIDQSLAHNGVCLTVVAIEGDSYTVTAIEETLRRSNLGDLKKGNKVNLERAMALGARLDGHIVQGHVDQVAECTQVEDLGGSWKYHFKYDMHPSRITIEKGSITVDGVSLTVVDSGPGSFSVAIIPYTYDHTRFKEYKVGSRVNLEFDMIGKYVARLMEGYTS
ncbi:riboflavin synthase [Robiginitalea aurantiaca]|uniref:Riboflavin synthase n=1 Tax=Robiginitalea aurantiaca TaxID=3056915 RepID=A0ABT7WE35_9FLAO|nr:riboflavin synthase [Robiginitalea aurantiaca]MDM9631186.1 riboflavin synthase [Robiginitalea aurantiaca]